MSDQNKDGRRRWLDGEKTGEDEFSQHADRGREELQSPDEAAQLLRELDAGFAAKFGEATAPAETAPLRDASTNQDPTVPTSAKVRNLPRLYAIAAAILLLIAIGSWWLRQQASTVDSETLYAESFETYANDLSGRTMGGTAADTDALLAAALLEYDRQDYPAAVTAFDAYFSAVPTSPAPAAAQNKARLYHGISALAANEPDKALTVLEPLRDDADLQHAVAWYRSLAFLRDGQEMEATSILTLIGNDDSSPFQERAKKLLTRL